MENFTSQNGQDQPDPTTHLIHKIAHELRGGQPIDDTPAYYRAETADMGAAMISPTADTVLADAAAGKLRLHPDVLEELPEMIAAGDIQFWHLDSDSVGAEGPDGFVGQVGARWSGTHNARNRLFVGNAANLAFLEVDETLRGQGLGEELVKQVVVAAEERGQGVFLTVRQDNEGAKRLYERLGFLKVGVTVESRQTERAADGTFVQTEPVPMDMYLRHRDTDPPERVDVPADIHDLLDAGLLITDLPGNDTKKNLVDGHPELLVRLNSGQQFINRADAKQALAELQGVASLPFELVEHDGQTFVVTKVVEGKPLEELLAQNPSEELLAAVEENWKNIARGLLTAKVNGRKWAEDINGYHQYMVGTLPGETEQKMWLVDIPDSATGLTDPDDYVNELLHLANDISRLEARTGRRLDAAREIMAVALEHCEDTVRDGDGLEQTVRYVLANPGLEISYDDYFNRYTHLRTR